MIRTLQAIGLLVLAAVAGICADQNKAEKPPPQPKAVAPKAVAPKGGAARGGAPKMGPQLIPPGSLAARLYRLSPAEREQALEKLPAARQQQIRDHLEYFDHLPKDQQQMMIEGVQRFAALSPQERKEFQQTMQAVNLLTPDRRQMVRQALRRLELLPEADRVIRLNSPAFKGRFSPEELHMIDKLSQVILPPM